MGRLSRKMSLTVRAARGERGPKIHPAKPHRPDLEADHEVVQQGGGGWRGRDVRDHRVVEIVDVLFPQRIVQVIARIQDLDRFRRQRFLAGERPAGHRVHQQEGDQGNHQQDHQHVEQVCERRNGPFKYLLPALAKSDFAGVEQRTALQRLENQISLASRNAVAIRIERGAWLPSLCPVDLGLSGP